MSAAIESEIRALFLESGDPSWVAQQLVKRWDANILSDDDIRTITRFMIQAGLHQHLFFQLKRCLKREMRVPWSAFAEALGQSGIKLEAIELDALFEGIEAQSKSFEFDMMFDFVESKAFDDLDPRAAAYRLQKKMHFRRAHEQKRADLQRQLEYARVNRLLSQEKRLLDEIQAFDPSDKELSREKNEFAYREAQEIVENALAQTPPKAEIERKFSQLSPELKKAAQPIIQRIRELAAKANEPLLYDLGLMLIFMELHEEGIRLLEGRRESSRIDWLLLETLILGGKYAAALGEVENLEIKYAGDSEAPFALTYARARALWGLGDTVTAIELIKSLARVRPGYRSANTLLQQWTEEAP